ncbi:hypothetical protein [Streptomyces sp. NL15-2K]|uniref:hypothetical protein n=1 Tax=Streptomyces sp. NL15-2K TaxID=376149 RepID=UPI00209BC80A|nr:MULTISPECIES: hypothetical protein [Actinomycetes]WKX07482.1 hypothetical protein Q4V64_08260 [Kutzneria buriramensis]
MVGIVAAGLAVTSSTGCTVPVDAVAGISVSDDGHLLGVMRVCGHRIDGATVYVDSENVNSQRTVGSWTADRPLTAGLATWTLQSPSPGWAVSRSLTRLTPKTTYVLYGWTKDNSWSSRSVSFDLTDLGRISPGTVRYDDISANGDESPITVPLAEFKATACKDR